MDDLLDKTTLKIRNDRQIQAETARRYHTDVEINLFTACHAAYNESTPKFNRKKVAGNGWTVTAVQNHFSCIDEIKLSKNSQHKTPLANKCIVEQLSFEHPVSVSPLFKHPVLCHPIG